MSLNEAGATAFETALVLGLAALLCLLSGTYLGGTVDTTFRDVYAADDAADPHLPRNSGGTGNEEDGQPTPTPSRDQQE